MANTPQVRKGEMQMKQPIPLPLKIEEYTEGFFSFKRWRILGANHTNDNWQIVADKIEKQDAQFIVTACNEHEELKEQNEELVELLQGTKGLCERLLEKRTGEFEYTEEWANDLLQGTRVTLAKAGK